MSVVLSACQPSDRSGGSCRAPPRIPPHDAGTEADVRECLGLQQGVEVMFQGGSQIHWLLWGWVVLLASEGPGSC